MLQTGLMAMFLRFTEGRLSGCNSAGQLMHQFRRLPQCICRLARQPLHFLLNHDWD
jgi:hypothetical protein